MMESLLKMSYGLYTSKGEKNAKASERVAGSFVEKHSTNCNICRNFANILDRSHRLSTSHQNKLTERLRIIRSKMKVIRSDSVAVHDNLWEKREEDFWCYFCDKSFPKHRIYEGCTIEHLGYLTHLADSKHMEAVKSYLKYHGRKDKFDLFCKTEADLEKFMDKIPEAKKKYLAKLNFLNQKDVEHIKEIELQRQLLVNETLQVSVGCVCAATVTENLSTQQTNTLPKDIHKRNSKLNQKPKICPWLLETEKDCDDRQDHLVSEKLVIGPTIDTLKKHVADQKKKMLPANRLGANFQRKQVYSSHWLPSFSGVWNKGRHRRMRMTNKHER